MSSRPLSLPESRRSFPRSRRRGAASGASWREELQIHNFSTMCPCSHRVLLTSPERRVGVFHSQPDEWAAKAWGLQKPPLPGEALCAKDTPTFSTLPGQAVEANIRPFTLPQRKHSFCPEPLKASLAGPQSGWLRRGQVSSFLAVTPHPLLG